MRILLAAFALGALAGCADAHRRLGGNDIIAMRTQGLSDREIVRGVLPDRQLGRSARS